MSETETYFTTARESLGYEPFIKRVNPDNSFHRIKNCSFKIKECQKFLELREEQVKNAIKIELLHSQIIDDTYYICIKSILDVKNNPDLREKIIDEDELTTNIVAEMLDISSKNVRRLIDEGYLKVSGTYEFKYGMASLIKRGEVKRLLPQMEEIKAFWKAQVKINRQMGAKKAAKIRLEGKKEVSFRDKVFELLENVPYKEAKLIKICFYISALNYYIERKARKNIIDQEMIDLFNNALRKFTEFYEDSEYLKIYFVRSEEEFITYCPKCAEMMRELKSELKLSWRELNFYFGKSCNKCKIDKDYYSLVTFFVRIYNYTFIMNAFYREIKTWFHLNKTTHHKMTSDSYEPDMALVDEVLTNYEDFKSFKIYEIIDFLKEFINSKELDFSFNI